MENNAWVFYVIDAVNTSTDVVNYLAFDEYNAELTMTTDVDKCQQFDTYDKLAAWLNTYKDTIKKQFSGEYSNFHVAKIIRTKLLLERLEDLG